MQIISSSSSALLATGTGNASMLQPSPHQQQQQIPQMMSASSAPIRYTSTAAAPTPSFQQFIGSDGTAYTMIPSSHLPPAARPAPQQQQQTFYYPQQTPWTNQSQPRQSSFDMNRFCAALQNQQQPPPQSAFQPVAVQQQQQQARFNYPGYFQQSRPPHVPMVYMPPQQMMMMLPASSSSSSVTATASTPNKRDLNKFENQKNSKKIKVMEKNKNRRSNGTKFSPTEEDDEGSMNGSACGLGGEHRLTIHFQNLGEPGIKPQTFGKSGYIIPDGVSGTHRMYSQSWQFEITHSLVKDTVVLTWRITNLSSGGVVESTETPQQAELRQTKGNTICNTVLRKALEQRIEELQQELNSKDKTPLQIANLRSLVKELCPKKCAQGLLFFGLRHEVVQNKNYPGSVLACASSSMNTTVPDDQTTLHKVGSEVCSPASANETLAH